MTDAPGEAEGSELVARLRVAVGRIARRLRQQGSGGLTLTQLSALVTIEQCSSVRLGDLAAIEGVAPSTLSRIVASLEDAGLVAREADPTDRRSSWVSLTEEGRDKLGQMRTERTLLLAQQVDALDDEQRQLLTAALPALERLASAFESEPDATAGAPPASGSVGR